MELLKAASRAIQSEEGATRRQNYAGCVLPAYMAAQEAVAEDQPMEKVLKAATEAAF